ncbi:MAG: DNA-binding response regulator MtrA, partial [Actinomycetota bacterium]
MKKVLVVEDDFELNESLVEWLEAAGYTATGVLEGGLAFPTFLQLQPDLVLLDVMLPGVSGIEIAQKIRQAHG